MVYREVRRRANICCAKSSLLRVALSVNLRLKQSKLLLDRFTEIEWRRDVRKDLFRATRAGHLNIPVVKDSGQDRLRETDRLYFRKNDIK